MTSLNACFLCVTVPPLVNALTNKKKLISKFFTCVLEYVYVTFTSNIMCVYIYKKNFI